MPTKFATLVLTAAVALVIGFLLGGRLTGTRSPGRGQPLVAPQSPAPSELAPVLAELARVLADLRLVLEPRPGPSAPSSDPPAREAIGGFARTSNEDSNDAELAAAVQALAASLRALEPGAGREAGSLAPRGLVVPAFVNRERAFSGVGLREAQDADDELAWERAMDAFRKRHLFWTTQQVLDAYGKPDEIEVGEQSSTWSYRLPVSDDEEETYTFYLSDGLVFSVDYSY